MIELTGSCRLAGNSDCPTLEECGEAVDDFGVEDEGITFLGLILLPNELVFVLTRFCVSSEELLKLFKIGRSDATFSLSLESDDELDEVRFV